MGPSLAGFCTGLIHVKVGSFYMEVSRTSHKLTNKSLSAVMDSAIQYRSRYVEGLCCFSLACDIGTVIGQCWH